jgi:metallo-beta-lactamase family protein
LLFYLWQLKRSGKIPKGLPVYLNSPMAVDATALYVRFHAEHRLSHDDCRTMCTAAQIINTPEQSKRLNERREPMVIIAASGMATGGRVVHHLKAMAPDARNTILLSGFQAGGTRGARLLAGEPSIKIHGEQVPVRAEVASLHNLSAHADADELLQWLRRLPQAPQQLLINHGEPEAADALRLRIQEELGWSCRVPDYRDVIALD